MFGRKVVRRDLVGRYWQRGPFLHPHSTANEDVDAASWYSYVVWSPPEVIYSLHVKLSARAECDMTKVRTSWTFVRLSQTNILDRKKEQTPAKKGNGIGIMAAIKNSHIRVSPFTRRGGLGVALGIVTVRSETWHTIWILMEVDAYL